MTEFHWKIITWLVSIFIVCSTIDHVAALHNDEVKYQAMARAQSLILAHNAKYAQ